MEPRISKWKPKGKGKGKGTKNDTPSSSKPAASQSEGKQSTTPVLPAQTRSASSLPTVIRVRRDKDQAPLESFSLPSTRSKRKAVDSLADDLAKVMTSDKRMRVPSSIEKPKLLVFRRVDSVASSQVNDEYYLALTKKVWQLKNAQQSTRDSIGKRDSSKAGAGSPSAGPATFTAARRRKDVSSMRKAWRRRMRVLDLIPDNGPVYMGGKPLRTVTPAALSSMQTQRAGAPSHEGVRILTPLERGYEEFIATGRLDQALTCVSRGQNVDYRCSTSAGDTLLTAAVQQLSVVVVQSALAKGATAQLTRGDGQGPLDLALDIQRRLLQRRSQLQGSGSEESSADASARELEQRLKDVSAICAILTMKIEDEVAAEEAAKGTARDAQVYDYFAVETVVEDTAAGDNEEKMEVDEGNSEEGAAATSVLSRVPRMNPDFLIDEQGRPVELDEDDEGIWNWNEGEDDDVEDEEEDSNAEDYVANEYPEEESDSEQDSFDADLYGYQDEPDELYEEWSAENEEEGDDEMEAGGVPTYSMLY